MYKHALAWRASFVERSPRAPRPQLQAARAIALKYGLKPLNAEKKNRSAQRKARKSEATKKRELYLRMPSSSAPTSPSTCSEGKLQAELRKYMTQVTFTPSSELPQL
jgi:hypothetical protein